MGTLPTAVASGVDGKEVAERVGVQAVVQKGRRALRKEEIKKELENKKEGGGKQARDTVGAPGTSLWGQCCLETPPASGELGARLSRKHGAASDTQEERPKHRNPGAAPEVGEGRLAGMGHGARSGDEGAVLRVKG